MTKYTFVQLYNKVQPFEQNPQKTAYDIICTSTIPSPAAQYRSTPTNDFLLDIALLDILSMFVYNSIQQQ